MTARGRGQAMDLDYGRFILWNNNPQNLLLITLKGIFSYRFDLEYWSVVENFSAGAKPLQIGRTGDTLAIMTESRDPAFQNEYFLFDLSFFQIAARVNSPPEGIVWFKTERKEEYPFYRIQNNRMWFDNQTGIIEDYDNREYTPASYALDEHYNRRYICYPGLGIGVADDRHLSLTIYQPGPNGSEVRTIALSPGGFIWTGSENNQSVGINLFDRKTGTWNKFDSDWIFGMDGSRIRDILIHGGFGYFASLNGLLKFDILKNDWKTIDRFDGQDGEDLTALETAKGYLWIGGEYGLSRMNLENGKFFAVSEAVQKKMHNIKDLASDKDTLWIAGLPGCFKWTPDTFMSIGENEPATGYGGAISLAHNDSRLWVGGRRGASELNRETGEWKSYLSDVFLENALPYAMEANDSLLWIGTDRGLFTVRYEKNSWIHYSEDKGIPNRIWDLKMEADTLWIGSPSGLTRFIWNRPERDNF